MHRRLLLVLTLGMLLCVIPPAPSFTGSLVAEAAPAAQGCATPPAGMIAWWPADGNANDMAGSNHATPQNGATFAPGRVGQAFSLDGVDDYFDVGNKLNLGTSDFTIEVWIRGDPTMESYGRIIDKGYSTGYALGRAESSSGRVMLEFNGSGRLVTPVDVVDNQWHHIAVVKAGATADIFADGTRGTPITVNTTSQSSSLPLWIGFNPGEGVRGHWKGQIDELAIFNRALSAAEIQGIVNAGATGKCRTGGVAPPTQSCTWTGAWAVNDSPTVRITLTQSGNQVTGTMPPDEFAGTVTGNRLSGRWTHGSDNGPFEFTMDSTCNRFTGAWGPDAAPRRGELNGTRVGGPPTPPTPPQPPSPPQPPAPPPPTGNQPGPLLGPLDLTTYCQSIAYTLDFLGFDVEVAPYDGAADYDGIMYCVALDILGSGIDVYSDEIDLNAACVWQYEEAAIALATGGAPPTWACARLGTVAGEQPPTVVITPPDVVITFPDPLIGQPPIFIPDPPVTPPQPPIPTPTVPSAPPPAASTGVQGLVRHAATGQAIAGATVSAGGRSATTDASGRYQLLGLAPGSTRVSAGSAGFISDEATVVVPSNGTAAQTFALSPVLAAGVTRIVLTWGQSPRDLDSHLWAGASHVYFGGRGSDTSFPFAILDTDDTSGFGPETITVDSRAACPCIFAVNNFSGEAFLSSSGARVQVYRGNAVVQTFTVPAGTGLWWHVLTLDSPSGTITPVNTLSNSEPTITTGQRPPVANPTTFVPTGGSVTGQVRHATIQGQNISGATIAGGGRTTVSGSDGRFELAGLTPGPVEVRVSAPGFVDATQTVSVPSSGSVSITVALSPVLAAGQTQIVLNWGASPSDLDSYLWLPSGARVSYQSRTGAGANLDVDDTNGFGPETITISQATTGTYTYAVNQFSGGGSLPTSGAVVRVNRGGSSLATFTAPTSGTGTWWHVFTMDGASGTITPINRLSDSPPR